jgi:hypothetical protein
MGHISFWPLMVIIIYWAKTNTTEKIDDLSDANKEVVLEVIENSM